MMKCGIGITTTFYSQSLLHDDTTILPIYDGDFSWTIEFIMKKGANISSASLKFINIIKDVAEKYSATL